MIDQVAEKVVRRVILGFLLGGLLLLRWPRLIWLHVPAVAWGVIVECLHLGCPLTPWENQLRRMAGQAGYEGGFIEHYLIPLFFSVDNLCRFTENASASEWISASPPKQR